MPLNAGSFGSTSRRARDTENETADLRPALEVAFPMRFSNVSKHWTLLLGCSVNPGLGFISALLV